MSSRHSCGYLRGRQACAAMLFRSGNCRLGVSPLGCGHSPDMVCFRGSSRCRIQFSAYTVAHQRPVRNACTSLNRFDRTLISGYLGFVFTVCSTTQLLSVLPTRLNSRVQHSVPVAACTQEVARGSFGSRQHNQTRTPLIGRPWSKGSCVRSFSISASCLHSGSAFASGEGQQKRLELRSEQFVGNMGDTRTGRTLSSRTTIESSRLV
jgi:hypothetical protein